MALGRPREFDIGRALEQAMKVFWQFGYEGASLAELTKAMGISSPSLYAAFGSKEGLFKAVLDHYAERQERCLTEVLAEPTARKAVERLLHGFVALVTDPEEPPGCLLLQGGLTCGVTTPEIPQELARRRSYLRYSLEQRLLDAQRTGDLPDSANPAALALFLTAVFNGIAIQAASGATRHELLGVVELALRAWPCGA